MTEMNNLVQLTEEQQYRLKLSHKVSEEFRWNKIVSDSEKRLYPEDDLQRLYDNAESLILLLKQIRRT
jgi:hypothetical protein